MFPPYSGNKVLTDAWLLDHQQMVRRELTRQRWARAARPTVRARAWGGRRHPVAGVPKAG